MSELHRPITRGAFLERTFAFVGAIVLGPAPRTSGMCTHSSLEHPDPRPGITAERVLAGEATGSKKDRVLAAYESARTYPEIFDGIACGCGCSGKNGAHRSLLVCFETMQPTGCQACQQEAQLVAKLAKDDTPLAGIRAAVDKKFG
ncbi:MAG TPA: hypothetical protein VIP11_21790 [Gemmatimonadaceae bacterium]